jgi:hypothetical protein
MTRFERIRMWVVLGASLGIGISAGWKAGLGVLVLAGLVLGVWTVISAGVDAALRPQEPRTDLYEPDPYSDYDPRAGDPTRPQEDEHPVIVLKDYQYRRHS